VQAAVQRIIDDVGETEVLLAPRIASFKPKAKSRAVDLRDELSLAPQMIKGNDAKIIEGKGNASTTVEERPEITYLRSAKKR
jgi:hypothetical protein